MTIKRIASAWRRRGVFEIMLATARNAFLYAPASAAYSILLAVKYFSDSVIGRSTRLNAPLENVDILLPGKIPFKYLYSFLRLNQLFKSQLRREPLLRFIVAQLIQNGAIGCDQDIVDIGAYISDNAVPWAMQIKNRSGYGKVHAIDPSHINFAYAELLIKANKLNNIIFYQAICSSIYDQSVTYEGSIQHAKFSESVEKKYKDPDNLLRTTTIDLLLGSLPEASTIGLMHIDVEGMELSTMKGAKKTIDKSHPIIIFEAHICDAANLDNITSFLQGMSYRIYMINEVLKNCQLDCRNFLAVPGCAKSSQLVKIATFQGETKSTHIKYWPAMAGPLLLPLHYSKV